MEYLIFCGDTDLNGASLDNITTDKWIPFNDHTRVWYASPGKISDNLVKQVERQKPDILFIVGLFSWHFNIVPVIFCKGPKKILSTRGMLHPGALSQKKWKKKTFLSCLKLLEYHHSISFHATDEEEEKYILEKFGLPAKVFIAGNFPNNIGILPMTDKESGCLKLISIAIVSPMKNILWVLKELERAKGRIQYDIYGPVKDEDYLDECKAQIKRLPANIVAKLHKEIEPPRVAEVLQEAHVFILPSKSENFGHAFYEALSAGRPVITSHFTPWNHLRESHAGINVSLDDNELSEAIDFFVSMNKDEFTQWHHSAVTYAQKAVDVENIRDEYRRMFLG